MLALDNLENSEKWEETNNTKMFLAIQREPVLKSWHISFKDESMLFLKLQLFLHLGRRTRKTFVWEDTLVGLLSPLPGSPWFIWIGNVERKVFWILCFLVRQKFFKSSVEDKEEEKFQFWGSENWTRKTVNTAESLRGSLRQSST